MCNMRICDEHTQPDKLPQVVMFANNIKDLPIVKSVGDIIRLKKAHVSLYKGAMQFTMNMFYESEWAIFSAGIAL
jgi:hypothetical protein